jgi:hypothetical protein
MPLVGSYVNLMLYCSIVIGKASKGESVRNKRNSLSQFSPIFSNIINNSGIKLSAKWQF